MLAKMLAMLAGQLKIANLLTILTNGNIFQIMAFARKQAILSRKKPEVFTSG